MFAYFKTRDLILPDWVNYSQIIAVRIGGTRWSECPDLRHFVRIPRTKSLTRQRLSGVINSYFVADNSLKSY